MRAHSLWFCLLMIAGPLSGGCDLAEFKHGKGDVNLVKMGWGMNQVAGVIGKPDYVIEGRGLRAGWEEWVYPTGSVFFHRMEVKHILKRSPETPPPPKPESAWDVPMLD